MGAYLEKPITDKTCDSQEANGMRAYSCSMQGWRITMEVPHLNWSEIQDTHVICTSLKGNDETAFYGVFDGHGGTYTSEFWFAFVFVPEVQQKPSTSHIVVPA